MRSGPPAIAIKPANPSQMGDSNWSSWSFKLKNILSDKDLWGLIDWSDLPPENYASDVKHRYKGNCNRAIAMITTNIRDSKIYLATSCEDTPRGMCDTLKEYFESKTISRKLFLMKAFFGLKMHEGTTVRDHIRALKDLIDKLRAVDTKIEDEIQVCIQIPKLYFVIREV